MCNRVTLEIELQELQKHHKELDESIVRGYTNYISDSNLTKMKQEKLMIKRRIVAIEAQLNDPFLNILR
jgi:hypothetical protein